MEVYVRGLQNDMIKPSNNCGFLIVVDPMTHKVLISDTTLGSFIPPQVRKMAPKLLLIFGYKLCIIPKDIQIDLNIFITILVIYLQQKSARIHTRNSLIITRSAVHYKEMFFQMINFYMLLSKMKLSASPIFILN